MRPCYDEALVFATTAVPGHYADCDGDCGGQCAVDWEKDPYNEC